MSKHTKGPWAVNPVKAQVDSFDGENPVPVCQMLWPTTKRTEDETEANANLIAASPDLLAALKAVLLSHYNGLNLARAAIAKAEGKS